MKIKNTGKVRLRIEGYGYVEPEAELVVPDDIGFELCNGTTPFCGVGEALPAEKKRRARKKKADVDGRDGQGGQDTVTAATGTETDSAASPNDNETAAGDGAPAEIPGGSE
jgi:hypothetical protein